LSKKQKNKTSSVDGGANSEKDYHREVASVSADIVKFFRKTFSEVHVDGPLLDPAEVQRCPVMFVGTHRSHADYFMIGANFCVMGFKNIRFAAGDNLTNLPWIGPRFVSFGAFAVSRDAGFERNYVRNLCNKVVGMLKDGDSILVFPEGGRSYSGSMLEMRGGILNAALLVQAADMGRDMYLIPSSVSYESPPDLPRFPLLLKGKKMRKKPTNFIKKALGSAFYFGADIMAFAPFMIAKHFGRKYGAAYMDYGAPVSVKSLVDLEANRVENARDEFAAHRVSLGKVEERVYEMFVKLFRILPVHAVSAAIKSKGAGGAIIKVKDLEDSVDDVKSTVIKNGQNSKSLDGVTSKDIVNKGLSTLRRLKAVKISRGVITINKSKLYMIDYYASAVI
jgi:1-acyl-sn-glycerol-3-phosphate acyltransferase